MAAQSGMPVTVDVQGEPRELPAEARLAVYRTAQEALTNVRRHASPERVEVRLDYRSDAVALEVRDHGGVAVPSGSAGLVGGGSAAGGAPGPGYGLTGMRERAELLGGTLVAEPTEDGFRVHLVLPA
jgi:signal transduction histidine kinase